MIVNGQMNTIIFLINMSCYTFVMHYDGEYLKDTDLNVRINVRLIYIK